MNTEKPLRYEYGTGTVKEDSYGFYMESPNELLALQKPTCISGEGKVVGLPETRLPSYRTLRRSLVLA